MKKSTEKILKHLMLFTTNSIVVHQVPLVEGISDESVIMTGTSRPAAMDNDAVQLVIDRSTLKANKNIKYFYVNFRN